MSEASPVPRRARRLDDAKTFVRLAFRQGLVDEDSATRVLLGLDLRARAKRPQAVPSRRRDDLQPGMEAARPPLVLVRGGRA